MLVNCFLLWLVHCRGCSCPRSALPLARARTAPTELLATARLVHCKGVQLSQLHQQSCWVATWLVHLRQVHPLRLLHKHLLHLATCCAHDVDAALQALHTHSAEVVYLDIPVVVGSIHGVDSGIYLLAKHHVHIATHRHKAELNNELRLVG